jgi:hypothetical protein
MLCSKYSRYHSPNARKYNWVTLFMREINTDLAVQIGRFSNLRQPDLAMSPAERRPEDPAGDPQQQL